MKTNTALSLLKSQFERKTFPHAFLFSGGNLVKKNEAVEFVVSKLMGENFAQSPDFYKIGGNKITIEEVKYLKTRAMETAMENSHKVFFIENLQNLTLEAMPPLLKILEEPPAATIFLATTTNLGAISPILRSRFSHFRFNLGANLATKLPSSLGSLVAKWDVEALQKLPYQKRFQEIPKLLETDGLNAVIKNTLLYEMEKLRKSFENPDKIERLLKIQNAASDPTVNKKLLGEYLMMNI